MTQKDIIDKICEIDTFILKQRNKEAVLRNTNQKECDEVLEELGYQTTGSVAVLLAMIRNMIPVSVKLLDNVRETATMKELKILEKHGIKI